MKIIDWTNQGIRETAHKVDVRLLYEKTDAQVMHIHLQPGEALKPHITPVDVFFFVLEGTPTIQVGNDMQVVQCNMLVESPKDIVHCLYNHSSLPIRILVAKTPKPTQSARIL